MPDWWSAAEMLVLREGSPISTKELWSSVRVTIGFLVTSQTKALLPRLLRGTRRSALGRVLVVPNFFHLRIMEHIVFLGTVVLQTVFGTLPPDLYLDTIPDNSFNLMTWFLLWNTLSTVGSYIDRCVPFQIMSIEFNLPQVDSNQVVETSQGWSLETGCTWAQYRVS